MLKPNRKIPKVAAAALVVGGCGGGGGGSLTDRVARSYCDAYLQCDPVAFDYYYATLASCRTANESYFDALADYYTAIYGATCVNANLRAYDCYYSEMVDEACDYYQAYYNCYDAYLDAYYACT